MSGRLSISQVLHHVNFLASCNLLHVSNSKARYTFADGLFSSFIVIADKS
uniref:Uncharacterized protein MANES_07G082700 n=1 Tax=Rhizophora mucronata TaxID=61149 RepID=A0A2P2IKD1_RHIMU